MSRKIENRCPGCSRHCMEGNVRCKYGRSYFEKQKAASQNETKNRKYKWERYVEADGTVWKLLKLSAELKKALKDGSVTEKQMADRLTEEERRTMEEFLDRMSEAMGKFQEDV